MKLKSIFFLLVIFVFYCQSVKAQLFFGVSFDDANCQQNNSTISNYSNLDYTLDFKYQYNFASIGINWGRVTRMNELNSDILETKSDRIALVINALPNNGNNPKFAPGLGIGCYARIPYEVNSGSNFDYDDFYATGITGNLALNFIDDFGFVTTGIKFNRDLSISSGNDQLKVNDYGFFISANLNISSIFKK